MLRVNTVEKIKLQNYTCTEMLTDSVQDYRWLFFFYLLCTSQIFHNENGGYLNNQGEKLASYVIFSDVDVIKLIKDINHWHTWQFRG